MKAWLKKLLAPPVFPDDEEKTRIARLLNIILMIVMLLVMLFSVPALLMTPEIGRVLIELALGLLALGMLILVHKGYIQVASFLLSLTLWVMITYGTYEAAGFYGSTMSSYFGIIVIAALLSGPKMGVLFGLLSIAGTYGLLFMEQEGLLPPPPAYANHMTLWVEFSVTAMGVIWLLVLVMTSLRKALLRARTNEKALAAKVIESQELASQAVEANQFKTRLLSRVSHELRTPLAVLVGMSEMLNSGDAGGLSEQQIKILQRIYVNSRYLERAFGEILDQSQIESGRLKLKLEDFSPAALLEKIHSALMAQAEKKGLSFYCKVADTIVPQVSGDEMRTQQIITNLVNNAIKFTSTGFVQVSLDMASPTDWRIQVSDTGPGIRPQDRELIFEPFRQSNESISREVAGVGLGLSIVHQLVGLMNGTLELESVVGSGSTFTVTLPVRVVVKDEEEG